jgi:hypothetical protein
MISHLFSRARSDFFSWIGIIGIAISIFDHLEGVLKLSAVARWLVTHWSELLIAFWRTLFHWLRIPIPELIGPLLSFVFFFASLAIGTRLAISSKALDDKPDVDFSSHALLLYLTCCIPLVLLRFFPTTNSLVIFAFVLIPLVIFVLLADKRLQASFYVAAIAAAFIIFVIKSYPRVEYYAPAPDGSCQLVEIRNDSYIWFGIYLTLITLPLLAAIAPIRLLNIRLKHAVIALFVIIALNEIAKLAPSQDVGPPRLNGPDVLPGNECEDYDFSDY